MIVSVFRRSRDPIPTSVRIAAAPRAWISAHMTRARTAAAIATPRTKRPLSGAAIRKARFCALRSARRT